MLVYHLMTLTVFSHWFSSVAALTLVLIYFLEFACLCYVSGLLGLISLHAELLQKFGLWSLIIINIL